MDEFNKFTEAHTCKETLLEFGKLHAKLGLDDAPHDQFFDQLGFGLKNNWKVKKLFDQFKKRFALKEYVESRHGNSTKVLIVGAGPCGLRIAIEAAFLGCKVKLIDKRNAFTRNNVLHLWPFVVTDLKNLGIKHFYNKFCCGELDHISIRRLQLSLLKIALILGVEVHTEVEFKGLKYVDKTDNDDGTSWNCVCHPPGHVVSQYEFDVLVAATGARDALCEYDIYNDSGKICTKQGFDRKEFRGQLSIAITANFINENSRAEMKAKEIGGVASHFNQKLFKDMERQKKIHLENFVYYKDETHYFVMTAKKSSLLERGVFKDRCKDNPEMLLQKSNINIDSLLEYARDAANFCTHNAMPNLQFAKNSRGAEDVAMLDFSSKFEAVNASRIIERNGRQLLVCLVGDSLLEPFWPQGTGCARGFLGAMDSAWMLKKWKERKQRPFEIIAERESIYKLLSQTNTNNTKKKYSEYKLDPKSRYTAINLKAVTPEKAKQYYDNIDTIPDTKDVVTNDEPPSKKSKPGDEVDISGLLLWCQNVLEGYTSIRDLTTSWRSGYALGILIHVFRPNLLNVDDLDPKSPIKTMNLVVDIAKTELGIYPVMAVSEMMNCSQQNETEMISYLSQFYEMFHRESIPEKIKRESEDMNVDVIQSFTPVIENTLPAAHVQEDVQSSDICYICEKELYFLERINVENIFCHRRCLRCDTCRCKLNLNNYRTRKTAKTNVKFYCLRHAKPGSVFGRSIRKRPFKESQLSNVQETDRPVNQNGDLPRYPEAVLRIPERPDFLARTVTSASLRRTDFYNSRDDDKGEEAEEKIFEHNFGASIRKGRGAFGNAVEEQQTEEKSSSDSSEDDDIGELVEENLGPVIDKNMTIKDAKLFWQTLKKQAIQRNVISYLEDVSHGTEGSTADVIRENEPPNIDLQEDHKEDLEKTIRNETRSRIDWTSARIHKGTEKDDETNVSTEQDDETNVSTEKDDETNVNKRRLELEERNNDLLEKRIKELNRESKEIEDMRFKFSATSHRPVKKDREENDQTPNTAARKRAMFKRSDSDQTEVRHAQRVQLAARKIAKRRQQNQFFMAQEITRQLEEAQLKLREVEKEGVEIEKALKENLETTVEMKPGLRRKLCLLYSQRQAILQYEADLRTANEQFSPSLTEVNKTETDILQSISSDDEDDKNYENDKKKELIDTEIDNTSSDNSADESPDTAQSDRLKSHHIPSTSRTTTPTSPESEQAAFSAGKSPDTAQSDRLTSHHIPSTSRTTTPTTPESEQAAFSAGKSPDTAQSDRLTSHNIPSTSRTTTPTTPESEQAAFSAGKSPDTAQSDRLTSHNIPSTSRTTTPTIPESEQAAFSSQDYGGRIEQSSPSQKEHIYSHEVEEKQLIDEFENVQIGPEPETEIAIWECPFCTLHNREEDTYCDVCYAWRCCICTFVNENRKRKCEMCYSNRPPRDQRQDERSRESFA